MLLQTDYRWENYLIGEGVTIGKEGCLLVCICIANTLLGNPLRPDELAAQLKKVDGFRANGELLWAKLNQTASILWLCFEPVKPIEGLRLIEYERPQGKSHFVLEYQGIEFDPKPGTKRFGIKSTREFARISTIN